MPAHPLHSTRQLLSWHPTAVAQGVDPALVWTPWPPSCCADTTCSEPSLRVLSLRTELWKRPACSSTPVVYTSPGSRGEVKVYKHQ